MTSDDVETSFIKTFANFCFEKESSQTFATSDLSAMSLTDSTNGER